VTFGEGFAVDLPGEATPTSATLSGPWGTSTTHTYTVTPPGRGLSFEFDYSDKTAQHVRNAGSVEVFFENVELMRHAPGGGKKARYNRKAITVAGHPGREYQIEDHTTPGAVVHLRVVAVRHGGLTRILSMRVTGAASRAGSPEARRFFDSLRVPEA
jgi:hypothetical protein